MRTAPKFQVISGARDPHRFRAALHDLNCEGETLRVPEPHFLPPPLPASPLASAAYRVVRLRGPPRSTGGCAYHDILMTNIGSSNPSSAPPVAMSDNIDRKWACEYCTYENFPSAIKCTMCSGPRPFEHIYRLHGERSPGLDAGASLDNCSSLSPQGLSVDNLHEHLQPLRIAQKSDVAQSLSRHSSPTNLENSRRSAQAKWNCQLCTFENWPRAIKCAMCGTAQPASSGSDAHQAGHAPELRENNLEAERRLRQSRRNADWDWLNACVGVVEGDPAPVEAYLAAGGDPARPLTAAECALLNRSSDAGLTLVHLAIKWVGGDVFCENNDERFCRFQREDLLAVLLAQIEGAGGSAIKRVPSYVAPELAADIRRHFATTLRQRKGGFACHYVTEFPTFTLPVDVNALPLTVQDQLMAELLDKDAQEELEGGVSAVINWAVGAGVSRLHALWNRRVATPPYRRPPMSARSATWGVFDRDNTLRRALAETLVHAGHIFYPRWKEYESSHASFLQYSLDEAQWEGDWSSLVALAAQPGSSLEQLHVFALAHILRRPILVYGVKVVKSFRGEALGPARFEGVYLPLLWDQSFCSRCPIALGYTRGHFSALVAAEPPASLRPRASLLPLVDGDRKPLPIHFLLEAEVSAGGPKRVVFTSIAPRLQLGREPAILRQWIDVSETEGGILVAQQPLHKRPLLVAQMCEEWLNHYRRLM
ncbi:hypothetical protein YQE_11256, partial [Dendroctonus ponderosae]